MASAGRRWRGGAASGPPAGRKPGVRYSAQLAVALCERVAGGELLYVVLREPGMPTPQSVARWARERADFKVALEQARAAGGRSRKGGGVLTHSEWMAEEICERLCDGESLTAIGDDPTMPSLSTLFAWRRRLPGFEEQVRLATRVRAERFCDLGWEMALAATPETAYLTHVQLTQLRWNAGVMAPRLVKLKAVEPEKPREVQTVLFRHFKIEQDPETGEDVVVAYCPNPLTGEAEREDAPGWRQAGDENTYSLPGGRATGQGYWADEG